MKIENAVFVCKKCSRSWGMDETRKQLQQVEKGLLIKEPDGMEIPLHFLPQLYSTFVHCPDCGSSNILLKDSESVRICETHCGVMKMEHRSILRYGRCQKTTGS